MKQRSKLSTDQQQEHAAESHLAGKEAQEFRSAEELLRHDAAQVAVPAAIGERLRESLKDSPPPPRAWWRRLLR